MNPYILLAAVGGYFGLLYGLAWWTNRRQQASLEAFYVANRQAPWYLVAFGMIGTSLSGVTFVSVPGAVGTDQLGYMQVVLGYLAGYVVIMSVLLPLYYRLRLVSIYGYLAQRFGPVSYRTGAVFFIVSRAVGSAGRLYLAIAVLQWLVFDALGVPFVASTMLTLVFIMLYTGKGGLRTIIATDTLQTAFMLITVGVVIWQVSQALDLSTPLAAVAQSPYGQMFFWDASQPNFFWKQFIGGMFSTIAMTGLDQDMMQKNLACRNLRQAQLNMGSYAVALTVVAFLFVLLGALLYLYADATGYARPGRPDQLFPLLAYEAFGPMVAVLFVLGLIAAAYSSADGSLAALTTSICVDLLDLSRRQPDEARALRTKNIVHWLTALAFVGLVLGFEALNQLPKTGKVSLITQILTLAGYTYGPLLGLYAFGLTTRLKLRDRWVPLVCLLAPLASYVLSTNSVQWLGGYQIGFELLLLNGGLTYLGLLLLAHRGSLSESLPDPLKVAAT